MKHIFGPVPSRRLGQSLGIDTVPLKTCNWNCIYCQLGRSRQLVNTRSTWFDPELILTEVREKLASISPPEIDWITFVGSGEPLLDLQIGYLIRQIKKFSSIPIAVITNGALLSLESVREEIMPADAVLPSLDSGNARLYKLINRPHPDLNFENYLDGLIQFSREYKSKLWVEVMLIKGVNDSEESLIETARILQKINPDQVHILQPTRPPVETWVEPADDEALLRARAIFGNIRVVIHPASGFFEVKPGNQLLQSLLDILQRHPLQQRELENILDKIEPGNTQAILTRLEDSGHARVILRHGVKFWTATGTIFPDSTQSNRVRPASINNTHQQKMGEN